ncbi:TIGR03503 family protein, partial [Pseudoalteromonas sp. S558]
EIERTIELIPEIPVASVSEAEIILVPVVKPKVMSTGLMVSLIVGGNLAILFIGWLCFRVFVQNKPLKLKLNLAFFNKKKAVESKKAEQQKSDEPENSSKNDKSGGILNLS